MKYSHKLGKSKRELGIITPKAPQNSGLVRRNPFRKAMRGITSPSKLRFLRRKSTDSNLKVRIKAKLKTRWKDIRSRRKANRKKEQNLSSKKS